MSRRLDPAWLVLLAGVAAALHVGKLPPAIPVLREALGISLVEAGFLLSMVQLAGMALGLVVGAAADALGARRTMVAGLAVLAAASLAGGFARDAGTLLGLRALEGLGFLLAALPAPGLLRRLVAPSQLNHMLGMWGAYMPLATALALLAGPAVIALGGWQVWWWLLAALSAAMAGWLALAVGPDGAAPPSAAPRRGRLARTLRSKGPWLVALGFAAYSGQWLAVVGFLPTIYTQAGWAAAPAAVATALVAAVNMVGNIASGRLLHRGVPAPTLLAAGFATMAAGALLAFGLPGDDATWAWRFLGVLAFSAVGGLVPGTLFTLAVRLAPDEGSVSTTVGWMQQWSALGQFVGPPVVAWVAGRAGGWHAVWWVTVAFSAVGLLGCSAVGRELRSLARRQAPAARS